MAYIFELFHLLRFQSLSGISGVWHSERVVIKEKETYRFNPFQGLAGFGTAMEDKDFAEEYRFNPFQGLAGFGTVFDEIEEGIHLPFQSLSGISGVWHYRDVWSFRVRDPEVSIPFRD